VPSCFLRTIPNLNLQIGIGRGSHGGAMSASFTLRDKAGLGLPSGRRRGRECDGERITAQDHQRSQPPDSALAIGISANQLGHVADRCRLSLDPPAWRGQRGALGLAGCQRSAGFAVSLILEARTGLLSPTRRCWSAAFLHAVLRLRPCPRRCQQQQHRGRVEEQRDRQEEPAPASDISGEASRARRSTGSSRRSSCPLNVIPVGMPF
jgi:hypothetical protein